MKLEDLKGHDGSKKARKRIGRGPGSGHGKTATMGNKGQKARAGASKGKGFEGGQMPLTPKDTEEGLQEPLQEGIRHREGGRPATSSKGKRRSGIKDFIESGLVGKLKDGVKLLSNGDIDFALKVKVHKASQKAIEKIKAQGGEVEVLQ